MVRDHVDQTQHQQIKKNLAHLKTHKPVHFLMSKVNEVTKKPSKNLIVKQMGLNWLNLQLQLHPVALLNTSFTWNDIFLFF